MPKVYRRFSLEFKRSALSRLAAGEAVADLAREFGMHRQLLYEWMEAARENRLGRRRGRPGRLEALAHEASVGETDDLALARRRIAELERKVGQQTVELDFFRGALRRIEASRPANDGLGVTGSSPRSGR